MINNPHALRGKIWLLTWPLILSNITQPLLGLVDSALLGHLPSQSYLGASALGSSVLAMVFWGFGFLRMGTTSLVSRAFGENRPVFGEIALVQNVLIALLLAGLLNLFAPLLLAPGILALGASDEVSALAISYSHIRLGAAPATLLNYALLGWFIGMQKTRLPLLVLLITHSANITLDVLFVAYWDLRSDGAAWASLISEYLGLGVALHLYLRHRPAVSLGALKQAPWRWRSLFTLNQHLLVRTCVLMAVFLFFTSQGARLSDTVLATNAILLQMVHLASYALDGLAHATETLAGYIKGQKRPDLHRALLSQVGFASLVVACGLSAGFWFFQNPIIHLFSDLPPIIYVLQQHFFWCVLLPLISVAAYVLDGYCIGAGHTKSMRDTLVLSALCVFLPAWWITQDLQNHGLWLAFCLFNLARGVSLGIVVIPTLRSQLPET